MRQSAILDDYMQRMAAVAPGDMLRWTGEELARAAERLRTAPEADRPLRAEEMLVTAHHHIQALADAGMADQALATSLLAPLTVIMSHVSPEAIPVPYCHSLALAAMAATDYFGTQQTSGAADMAAAIAGAVTALFAATVRAYSAGGAIPEQLVTLAGQLTEVAKANDTYTATFDGHEIVPTMAIDILVDSLNRLRSLGVEF